MKTIIFDVSGTLWDDLTQVFIANEMMIRETGKTHFPNDYGPYGGKELCPEGFRANGKGSAIEVFRCFGFNDETDKELDKIYQRNLAVTQKEHPVFLYDGISDMLNMLNNKLGKEGLYVVSSHPKNRLEEDFERLGVLSYFNEIHGNRHGEGKDVSITTIASEKRNPNLPLDEQMTYVGDTKSDMISANNVGVFSLGVSYGYQRPSVLRQGNPNIVRATPKTLHKFLESFIQ
jgi:phosphoglycolate phosphatase